MDALYAALAHCSFDTEATATEDDGERRGTTAFREPVLAAAGLLTQLAQALDDDSWNAAIQAETDEALSLVGKDVGTPILHFRPPDGVAFFGPVISRLPDEESALELWDHVVGLAGFPGFAELKRSLLERPRLVGFGVEPDAVGVEEAWHDGSRRQHR